MGDPMKRPSGIIAIVILCVLVMTAYLNLIVVFLPTADAINTVTQFKDGSTEIIGDFPGTNYKEITLPVDANVTGATIKISTMEDGGDYPEDIQILFGDTLPIDWAYRGEGHGAFGHQQYFSKGQMRVNLSYDVDKTNDTLFFYLPRGADVTSASVKLTGFEYDYWEPKLTEVNWPDSRPYSWNQDPIPFVYQNQLWVFYRTYNTTEAGQSDADLCYNTTNNGDTWLPKSIELTPSPDTPVPYPESNDPFDSHLCGDYHPVVVQFNNEMGVFWGSASAENVYGVGLTHGTDRDIVCQWYDGSWGSNVEITAPNSNANETALESSNAEFNYTRNPGPDPWGKDDRRPNTAVFNGKVYCVWSANNTGNSTFHMHDHDDEPGVNDTDFWWEWGRRGDILISSSSDGVTWSRAMDLTAYDEFRGIDFAPSLNVFNGKLYCIWETNSGYYNDTGVWKKKVDVENKYDFDLVYRYTSDGVTWSDHIELTPVDDTPDGENRVDFSFPDEDPRLITFRDPVTSENRMYAVWRTRNPAITNGSDYDIVLYYTTDGLNWTKEPEMTAPENGNFDNKPELTEFNNKLYVVWRRLQGPRDADNADGDIVTRHWDGKEWSVLQEITPWDGDGTGNDDFYPNSVVFKEDFYTFWCTRNRGTGWPEGTNADVVYRRMQPSDLPIDVGLWAGNGDIFKELIKADGATKLTDANPSIIVDDTNNFKSKLNELLDDSDYVDSNIWLDSYGNEMVRFMAKVYIGQPGRVRFDDLDIKYTCTLDAGDGITVRPVLGENPFRAKINDYLETVSGEKVVDGNVDVKLQVKSNVKGKVKVHDMYLTYNMKPSINLLTPIEGTHDMLIKRATTGNYTITWEDKDVDDNADISLYFHKVNDKSTMKLIEDNIKENDGTNSYTWVFTKEDAPTGSYKILGRISDGIDIAEGYAPGTLNITWEKQYPPWIKIVKPIGFKEKAWDFYKIKWEDYDANSEDNAKIYLYYLQNQSDYENGTQIDINGDGEINDTDFIYENEDGTEGEFDWNISSLAPGSVYFVAAKIDDSFNPPEYNCSSGRVLREYIDSPQNFSVVGDLNPDPNIWETHMLNPQLTWRMEYSGTLNYQMTVWEGSNKAGIKIFKTSVNDSTSVINKAVIRTKLDYGQTYYAELYAVSSSGARSEVVTLQFSVINRLPGTPTVVITPAIPVTSSSLSCEVISDVIDEDGDTINFSYKWYKNEDHQIKYDEKRNINPEDTAKHDIWKVEVTPMDPFGEGLVGSASVVVINSKPNCRITLPSSSATMEYFNNEKTSVNGEASDLDNDPIVLVEWYLDLENPTNFSSIGESGKLIKQGADVNALEALSFNYKFPAGLHNLTLYVYDDDSQDAGEPTLYTITFEVKKAKDEAAGTGITTVISGVAIIVVVIIVILILLIFLKRRKPVSEREQMYGTDLGLKPGEAYPVESKEKKDSYFGDELDRKGVSSIESTPPSKEILPATTEQLATGKPQESPAVEGKAQQPQLPPLSTTTKGTESDK